MEEAIYAVGALAGCIGVRFVPYLQNFMEYVVFGLGDSSAAATCRACTMCVGDIARALGENISPHLE